jgi:hypothetical protein
MLNTHPDALIAGVARRTTCPDKTTGFLEKRMLALNLTAVGGSAHTLFKGI